MFDSVQTAVLQAELSLGLLKDRLAEETAAAWIAVEVEDDRFPGEKFRKAVIAASPAVVKSIQIDDQDEDEKIVLRTSVHDGEVTVRATHYQSWSTSIEKRDYSLKFGEWVDVSDHSFSLARSRAEAEALVSLLEDVPGPGALPRAEQAALDACYPTDDVWDAQQCEQTPTLRRVPKGTDMDAVVATLMEGVRK